MNSDEKLFCGKCEKPMRFVFGDNREKTLKERYVCAPCNISVYVVTEK